MFGFRRKSKKTEPPLWAGLPIEKVDRDTALRQLIDSNFSDCVKAYANAESGSTLERLAFEKIKKTGRTFDDFLIVYDAVAVTPAGRYALEKMMSITKAQAKTAEDWEIIAESSFGEMREFAVDMMIKLIADNAEDLNDLLSADVISTNENFKTKVLDRIRALTLSSDKWLEVLADENMDDATKEVALEKLIADPTLVNRSFKDWEKLFDEAEEGSEFERHAASMLIDKVDPNNPDDIASLANSNIIKNDKNFFNRVVEKLRVAVAPFQKWKEAYGNFDDSGIGSSSREIVDLVLLKMIDSINNVEDLIEADEAIDDDNHTDDTREKFEAKAKLILITEQACQRIIDEYYADDDLFEVAGEWMIASAKTTKECVDIFFSAWEDWKTDPDEGGNVNDELVAKAIDHLVDVATDSELYIISKFPDNDFSNLAKTASNQLDRRQKLRT